MLEQRGFAVTDTAELRHLVAAHGWATLASATGQGPPVVSHLPVLPDPETDEVVVLGHLARVDAEQHRLGECDVTLVIRGVHGYISPSWYEAGPYVPTWNFVVVHLEGRPVVLDADETYAVLSATVDHFESARRSPWKLDSVPEFAQSLARHAAAFRLHPSRIVGKAKLSQDKPADVHERVVAALETDEHHANPELAAAMRQAGTR